MRGLSTPSPSTEWELMSSRAESKDLSTTKTPSPLNNLDMHSRMRRTGKNCSKMMESFSDWSMHKSSKMKKTIKRSISTPSCSGASLTVMETTNLRLEYSMMFFKTAYKRLSQQAIRISREVSTSCSIWLLKLPTDLRVRLTQLEQERMITKLQKTSTKPSVNHS